MFNYWFYVSNPFNIKYKNVKRIVVRKIVMGKNHNIVLEDMETEGNVLCITKQINYSLKNINIELSKLFVNYELEKRK